MARVLQSHKGQEWEGWVCTQKYGENVAKLSFLKEPGVLCRVQTLPATR